ncbi:hypothetical protein [Arthrobacter sp. E3]|uniref:hypothetical protein n=1 Tax=Arthrobacter sp. E3 TaxID=517402 RepID=UPI001A94DAD0|nr:hypothetical protein [Arthrobacter sp. E3]
MTATFLLWGYTAGTAMQTATTFTIDSLKQQGYRFVTVDELTGPGLPPVSG